MYQCSISSKVQLICLLSLILLVLLCQAYPTVSSAYYKEKSGEVQRATLKILEYDIRFNEDIFLLKARNCPAFPSCTTAASTCPPCNYASIATCGESPPGCPSCPRKAELCPADVVDRRWVEVPVDNGFSLENTIALGSTVNFRWYIPDTKGCSGFELELSSKSGDPDVSSAVNLNANTSSAQWFSLNSGSDLVTFCPTDDGYATGTYEAQVYGYLEALSTAKVTTASVVHDAAPAVACNLPTHTCLQSDVEENRSLPDISSTQMYYYAIAVTGACPRQVSIWQQIVESEDYFLMSVSTVHPFPDPTNASQFSELIIFEDFTTHSIAMSFCPADLTKPTIVYITLERQSLSATTLLLRATSNPVNFYTLPLNVAAPTSYDMGHLMLQEVVVRLEDTVYLPCDRFYGGTYCAVPDFDHVQGIFAPHPPYNVTNVLNPPWPWLWVTKRSGAIVDGTTTIPPSIPRAFDARKFAFSMIVQAELVQDGVAQRSVYVSPEQYDQLEFKFRPQLVGSDGQPIAQSAQASWLSASREDIPCEPSDFFRVKGLIDSVLAQLENSSLADTDALLSQLDVLNFLDSWSGCKASTESLLDKSETFVLLSNSTLCTPELTAAGDPCCSLEGLWTSCCAPRDVNLTVTAWTQLVDSAIVSRCGGSRRTCVSQFLLDYSADTASKKDFSVGCSGSVVQRDSFFRASNTFWKECMDEMLGDSLGGIDCSTDADCTALGAIRCNMNTLKCSFARDVLAKTFIQCFVSRADPFILAYIRETVSGANVPDSALPDAIFTALQQNDCLPLVNVDPTVSRSYSWTSNGCDYGCIPDPVCLYTLCTIPVGCMWSGFPSLFCPRDPYWVSQETDQQTCASRTRCNDLSSTDCSAGSFCGVCEDDGYCWPLSSVSSEPECSNTYACASPSAPHTYTQSLNPAQCDQQFSCTASCWDGSNEIPCATQAACLAAGSCSDYDWFTSDTDSEGACVLPVAPFYIGGDCEATYSIPNSKTSPLGCVNVTASQTECPGLGGTWYKRARTAAACNAHGTGCLQPTPIDAPSALQPQFVSPKSQTDCTACGFEPTPYFSWSPAQWVKASVRKPRWLQRTASPAGNWTSGFAYDQLGAILDAAVSRRYDIQVRAEQSCRFSRPVQSIGGIACSCSDGLQNSSIAIPRAESDKCIADELTTDLVIGISQACGGSVTRATALPFQVEFDATSVPEEICTTVKFQVVSKYEYRFVKPASVASTFIPPVTRLTFEFSNTKSGVIGEFSADGVELVLDAQRVPVNFTLCVEGVLPPTAEYPVQDFAVITPSRRIVPLELNGAIQTVVATQFCALFRTAPLALSGSNSSFIVFPVNRVDKWRSKEYHRFSGGERALLIVAGVWYFAAMACCIYGGYRVVFRSKRFTYQPQIVWPVLVLCLVRSIYCFMLAGNQLISERVSVGEFFLTDFPLNLYISVMQFLVLYWILVVFAKVNLVLPIGIAFNVVLYAMFFTALLLMRYLPYKSIDVSRLACQFEGDQFWTNRRILNVTYKIILSIICVLIALAFAIFGRQIWAWLRKVEEAKHHNGISDTHKWYQLSNSAKLLFLAVLSTGSLLALCAFLLLLTAVSWRSTIFGVLFLSCIELFPLLTLIFLIISNREGAASASASSSTVSGAGAPTSAGTSINAWTNTDDDF